MQKSKIKFTDDIRLLLIFNSLHKVSDLFLGTFMVSFIMQRSFYEIIAVSQYQFFYYIALCLSFIMLGNWVKCGNKVVVFGLNLLSKAILLLGIIFYPDSIVQYIIPFGMIYGLTSALYWLPMHTMINEKVSASSMTKFTGYRNAINGITKIIAPVLLGFFITVGSYQQMAIALLVLSLVEFALIFKMKPSIHRSQNKLNLIGFANCMLRFPVIRKLLSIEVLRGFSVSGVLGTVITMYTVYMFKTDVNLGIFTTVFSVFAILTSYLFGRFAQKSTFPKILFAASLSSVVSLILFVFWTSEITFLFYNFIYVTAMSLLTQICDVNTYILSKAKCVTNDRKTEYFIFRDLALGVGRLTGYLILMYIGVFGGYEWLRYYLIVLTVAILLMGHWSIRINKHIKG